MLGEICLLRTSLSSHPCACILVPAGCCSPSHHVCSISQGLGWPRPCCPFSACSDVPSWWLRALPHGSGLPVPPLQFCSALLLGESPGPPRSFSLFPERLWAQFQPLSQIATCPLAARQVMLCASLRTGMVESRDDTPALSPAASTPDHEQRRAFHRAGF